MPPKWPTSASTFGPCVARIRSRSEASAFAFASISTPARAYALPLLILLLGKLVLFALPLIVLRWCLGAYILIIAGTRPEHVRADGAKQFATRPASEQAKAPEVRVRAGEDKERNIGI